jgi:hypothetical protein
MCPESSRKNQHSVLYYLENTKDKKTQNILGKAKCMQIESLNIHCVVQILETLWVLFTSSVSWGLTEEVKFSGLDKLSRWD